MKKLRFSVQSYPVILDSLAIRRNHSIHIAFVGDFVVRHHFYTFIQVSKFYKISLKVMLIIGKHFVYL